MAELTAFHFERTITDEFYRDVFVDITRAGHEPPATNASELPLKQQRSLLLGWCAVRGDELIDDVLTITEQHAPERLAKWAEVLMRSQVNLGHELALYSGAVPREFLRAFAYGIEEVIGEEAINTVVGKGMPRPDGRNTNQSNLRMRQDIFDAIDAVGHRVTLVADSFSAIYPTMRFHPAARLLAVNPEAKMRYQDEYDATAKIFWQRDDLDSAHVRLPRSSQQKSFDLMEPAEQERFLNTLGLEAALPSA
jgi:hypothetical protein